jgi:hypothetical protein
MSLLAGEGVWPGFVAWPSLSNSLTWSCVVPCGWLAGFGAEVTAARGWVVLFLISFGFIFASGTCRSFARSRYSPDLDSDYMRVFGGLASLIGFRLQEISIALEAVDCLRELIDEGLM